LVFANAAFLLITACSKRVESSPAIAIEQEISPQPVRVGTATVAFRLTDAAAKPASGARITLEADMSHPGMAPVFGEAQEVSPGRYQSHLEFSMAGDWVILLHIKLSSGQKVERQMDVRGVQPN
jgi:YtkA-like